MSPKSILRSPHVGSGIVITLGALIALFVLLCFGQTVGWNPTWRAVGVTPLDPHFFDMHVPIDYATCAARGIDPYIPHACNPANFNLPPIWLWLSSLGIKGSDAPWLSVGMIAIAFGVVVALLKGRSVADGLIVLIAILSPSVLMGVERANADLLIFALVGAAALTYNEQKLDRTSGAIALLSLGIVLKLFPLFSVALAARFNRRTLAFAIAIGVFSMAYIGVIFKYILLIRSNVPTTFMLSYGYKALFLGVDHLRTEAGFSPFGLADTWVPISVAMLVLIFAATAALGCFLLGRTTCVVPDTVAGTAFLFGSGIYCGTYLLGTNFIYRLMFLLLCLPQLQEWMRRRAEDKGRVGTVGTTLLIIVLSVLWLNGNSNGHTTFLLVPQLVNWLLFFGLAAVLMFNFLNSAYDCLRSADALPAPFQSIENLR
jgi:hypothetical protein